MVSAKTIDAWRAAEAEVFWTNLFEYNGKFWGLELADDGVPLGYGYKANMLSHRISDYYEEENGTAKAMVFVREYLAASGIEDHYEAKFFRQLFLATISAEVEKNRADDIETLCMMVSLWAAANDLAQTTIRVKSIRDE